MNSVQLFGTAVALRSTLGPAMLARTARNNLTSTHMICLKKVIAVAIVLCVSCRRLDLRVNCKSMCGAVSMLVTLGATFLFFSFFLFGDPKQAKCCRAAGRPACSQRASLFGGHSRRMLPFPSFSLWTFSLSPHKTQTHKQSRDRQTNTHTLYQRWPSLD